MALDSWIDRAGDLSRLSNLFQLLRRHLYDVLNATIVVGLPSVSDAHRRDRKQYV